MRKSKLFMGLLSIAVILASCSKDENNGVETSKAIRDGNFLQAADFKDVSKLNIHHSDKYVTEKFENGEAEFKYSQPETRSTNPNYKEQITEFSLFEEQLVEFEDNVEYVLEFSYCFVLEREFNEDEQQFQYRLLNSLENINLVLQLNQAVKDPNDDYFPGYIIKLGSDGDKPLNDKWKTYRTTIKPMVKELGKYWNINFTVTNKSKQNNNTFHIRNIQLVKK